MGLGGCFQGVRGAKMHPELNAALGPLIAPRNRKALFTGAFSGVHQHPDPVSLQIVFILIFVLRIHPHKYRREVLNARGVGERDPCPFEKLRQPAHLLETTTIY